MRLSVCIQFFSSCRGGAGMRLGCGMTWTPPPPPCHRCCHRNDQQHASSCRSHYNWDVQRSSRLACTYINGAMGKLPLATGHRSGVRSSDVTLKHALHAFTGPRDAGTEGLDKFLFLPGYDVGILAEPTLGCCQLLHGFLTWWLCS